MKHPCRLVGIPMNIYEENSAHNFRVQSESEWTLVILTRAFQYQCVLHTCFSVIASTLYF